MWTLIAPGAGGRIKKHMSNYEKNIVPQIEAIYASFSPIEKTIADFFIHNQKQMDFSAKNISALLFVSEPSLSRFAKKCGYKGYREFLFHYQESLNAAKNTPVTDDSAKQVLNTYQELLNKSYALVDDLQMDRLCEIFATRKRIYVYGKGSSGLSGHEMKLRFMRIGVNIEAISDNHVMKMNSVLLDHTCAVIGITVSGKTPEVIDSLKAAKTAGAAVILMTSHMAANHMEFCDEIVLLALRENLENGKAISPQFPILVMIDLFYSHFLKYDTIRKEALHDFTMDILHT